MPGRQTVTYDSLQFHVRPAFWLRNLLHFPFYFESTNPTFKVRVKRISDPEPSDFWAAGNIVVEVVHVDGGVQRCEFSLPDLTIGQSVDLTLEDVYTWYPGQTIMRLSIRPGIPGVAPSERSVLYSYQVRTEEQLWLGLIGPIVGLPLGVGTTVLGVSIQRWLS